MRNLHYKNKNYRLSDEIIKKLSAIKKKENISYNLLFKKLLDKKNDRVK